MRFNEIIDRVVEAGLHKFENPCKRIVIKYIPKSLLSFTRLMDITALTCITCNLSSIYCCLSAFCFMVEVLYNRFLSKII